MPHDPLIEVQNEGKIWDNLGTHDTKRPKTIYQDKFGKLRGIAKCATIWEEKVRYTTGGGTLITRRS